MFGKVNCKNIKQDCPDPDCDDPVLRPGHCCKTCPKGLSPHYMSLCYRSCVHFCSTIQSQQLSYYILLGMRAPLHMLTGGGSSQGVAFTPLTVFLACMCLLMEWKVKVKQCGLPSMGQHCVCASMCCGHVLRKSLSVFVLALAPK